MPYVLMSTQIRLVSSVIKIATIRCLGRCRSFSKSLSWDLVISTKYGLALWASAAVYALGLCHM